MVEKGEIKKQYNKKQKEKRNIFVVIQLLLLFKKNTHTHLLNKIWLLLKLILFS